MSKKFFSLFMGAAIVASTLSLASCNKDDDDNDPKKDDVEKPQEAKTATAQVSVYFADDMLRIYDVTCTVDGNAVALTTENTDTLSENMGYEVVKVRKFTTDAKTYESFPASLKVSAQAKVKEGMDLKKVGEFDFYFKMDKTLSNDAKLAFILNQDCVMSQYLGGADFSNAGEDDQDLVNLYSNVSGTMEFNFTSASTAEFNNTWSFPMLRL